MKYYTFLPRFHAAIRSGIKTSTIRYQAQVLPGTQFTLRFWTGRPYGSPMGTLGTAICWKAQPIYINVAGEVWIDNHDLTNEAREGLARQEGFTDTVDMMCHFETKHQLPLHGILTTWVDYKESP